MKKIISIAGVFAIATVASFAQGTVVINQSSAVVKTNTTLGVSGNVAGTSQYFFTLLISGNTALDSTANQIYGNAGNYGLWTDTGATGVNGTGINAGKLSANTAGVAASGWAFPGFTYDNLRSVIIVGWSASYGATWASIQNAVLAGNLAPGGYFGVTAVGTSYAGGANSLPAVNVWSGGGSPATGITPVLTLNQVAAVPEPSTLVLAGLGGLSLLAFRRKK